jgi:hypothetical protein
MIVVTRLNLYLTIILGAGILASTAPVLSAPIPARAPKGGGALLEKNSASNGSKFVCFYNVRGDNVHISNSAYEASGHGWWVNINCPATLAVVTVQLQEYYSDGSWRNKGTLGRSTVRSGGGSGNRATGRAVCNNRG